MNTNKSSQAWLLQICHGYEGPFLECARQYGMLFANSPYREMTVYLTGEYSVDSEQGSGSDELVFLGYFSKALRGLKLSAVRVICHIAMQRIQTLYNRSAVAPHFSTALFAWPACQR